MLQNINLRLFERRFLFEFERDDTSELYLPENRESFFYENLHELDDMPKFIGPKDYPNASELPTEDQFVLSYLAKNIVGLQVPKEFTSTDELLSLVNNTYLGSILPLQLKKESREVDGPVVFDPETNRNKPTKVTKEVDTGIFNISLDENLAKQFLNPSEDIISRLNIPDTQNDNYFDRKAFLISIGQLILKANELYNSLILYCVNYSEYEMQISETKEKHTREIDSRLAELSLDTQEQTKRKAFSVERLKITIEFAEELENIIKEEKDFLSFVTEKSIEIGEPSEGLTRLLYILYKFDPNHLNDIPNGTKIDIAFIQNSFKNEEENKLPGFYYSEQYGRWYIKKPDTMGVFADQQFISDPIKFPDLAFRELREFSVSSKNGNLSDQQLVELEQLMSKGEKMPTVINYIHEYLENESIAQTQIAEENDQEGQSVESETQASEQRQESPKEESLYEKTVKEFTDFSLETLQSMNPNEFRLKLIFLLSGITLSAISGNTKQPSVSFRNEIINKLKTDYPQFSQKIADSGQLDKFDDYINSLIVRDGDVEENTNYTLKFEGHDIQVLKIDLADESKKTEAMDPKKAERITSLQEEKNQGTIGYIIKQTRILSAAGIDPNNFDFPGTIDLPFVGKVPIDRSIIAGIVTFINALKSFLPELMALTGKEDKEVNENSIFNSFTYFSGKEISEMLNDYGQIEKAKLRKNEICSIDMSKERYMHKGNITIPTKTASSEPLKTVEIYINGKKATRTQVASVNSSQPLDSTATTEVDTTQSQPTKLDEYLESLETATSFTAPMPPEELWHESYRGNTIKNIKFEFPGGSDFGGILFGNPKDNDSQQEEQSTNS